MSNCYTTFYFSLPLQNSAQAKEVGEFLDAADDYINMDPDRQEKVCDLMTTVFSEFEEYQELGFEWEIQTSPATPDGPHTLCVYHDENGNVEHATELIQWLLPDLDIKAAGFSYAMYGGGGNEGGAVAVIKTADGIDTQWVNSESWLAEKLG